MPAEPLPVLQAGGPRVWVRTVQASDIAGFRTAVEMSRSRLERWNPTSGDELAGQLAAQGAERRTFVVHARQVEGAHDTVGRVNVVNIVRGRFRSASVGYDAYDPYAGRGLFAEGLALVVSLALAEPTGKPPGMGLHRVEAGVQPGNVRSAALLRSLGFALEGRSPRMLWLPDAAGTEGWRDHLRLAVTREGWPGQPYAAPVPVRAVVTLTGSARQHPGLGAELGRELGVPLLGPDLPPDTLWAVLALSPQGAVLDLRDRVGQDGYAPAAVATGLASAGLDPAMVPEIWCGSGNGTGGLDATGSTAGADSTSGESLGIGPRLSLGEAAPVPRRDVVRLALEVGALAR